MAQYSSADAGAPDVQMADEAVHTGAPPAAQSYLDKEALLAPACAACADAVHPD